MPLSPVASACLASQTPGVGRVHVHPSSRAFQGQRGSPPAREAVASRTGWEGRSLPGLPSLTSPWRAGSMRKDHFKFLPQVTEQVNRVTSATWVSRFPVRC